MGLFFSNIHVRRNTQANVGSVQKYFVDSLCRKGYHPVDTEVEADVALYLYDAGGEWISVCGDTIEFEAEESIGPDLTLLSKEFSTDAMAIGCFDSDCLFLNLIDAERQVDAWAKIGRFEGIRRRSNPSEWKGKVTDLVAFKKALKGDYVFAEEALEALEPLFGMVRSQGIFSPELIGEEYNDHVTPLWFALPEGEEKHEPPRFEIKSYSLSPCTLDCDYNFISVRNMGGKTKGLLIAFTGSYVDRDEITFRNVHVQTGFDNRNHFTTIPIELQKEQLKDGRWAYMGKIPSFSIPAAVKKGLPYMREEKEWYKREFGIRFHPTGNARKLLDICVHIVPLKNPAGQCCWCVWHHAGSKRAFIEWHNRQWGQFTPGQNRLDPNDFDLD